MISLESVSQRAPERTTKGGTTDGNTGSLERLSVGLPYGARRDADGRFTPHEWTLRRFWTQRADVGTDPDAWDGETEFVYAFDLAGVSQDEISRVEGGSLTVSASRSFEVSDERY